MERRTNIPGALTSADSLREADATVDLQNERLHVGVVEGQLAAHHGVQDNTNTPHVRLAAIVRLAVENLRRCIGTGATECLEQLVLLEGGGKAEIRHLNVVGSVQ